MKEIGYF